MSAFITATALQDVSRYFEALPEIAEQAAVLAINQVVERDGMSVIRKDMRDQINFPKGYLEQEGRLKVTKKARQGDLSAIIRGRDRGTSLARFLTPGQRVDNTRGGPLKVQVAPGKTRVLKGSFLVKLRNGNTGLAVRLKPGERLRKSEKAVRLSDNLFLLYGPSVDQVFKGVADDRSPEIAEMVSRQFIRQFGRLSTRG